MKRNIVNFLNRKYLSYLLLNFRQHVQKTGCNEDPTRETGTETDKGPPAYPGLGIVVVPHLGEEFDREHPEEEGNGGHGEQCYDLLSHQTDTEETLVLAGNHAWVTYNSHSALRNSKKGRVNKGFTLINSNNSLIFRMYIILTNFNYPIKLWKYPKNDLPRAVKVRIRGSKQ